LQTELRDAFVSLDAIQADIDDRGTPDAAFPSNDGYVCEVIDRWRPVTLELVDTIDASRHESTSELESREWIEPKEFLRDTHFLTEVVRLHERPKDSPRLDHLAFSMIAAWVRDWYTTRGKCTISKESLLEQVHDAFDNLNVVQSAILARRGLQAHLGQACEDVRPMTRERQPVPRAGHE